MSLVRPDGAPLVDPRRVTIVQFDVVAPNIVELVANGLDLGDSVAHLRVTNPLKASQVWVPLLMQQVDELAQAFVGLLPHLTITDVLEGNNHGEH